MRKLKNLMLILISLGVMGCASNPQVVAIAAKEQERPKVPAYLLQKTNTDFLKNYKTPFRCW